MESKNGVSEQQFTGLILVSGVDSPGITEALFEALSPFAVTILDIQQVVIRGRLILTVLISLSPPHAKSIEADLEECATKLGVDIATAFESSDQKTIAPKKSLLHVVVLSQSLKPAAINAIAAVISEDGGNIERINRTASYPVTAIELTVSGADLGVQSEIAKITEAAMRGELDFEASLRARVALLKGLPASVLEEVQSEITLTPGARTLVRTLKKLGHHIALVSGGFEPVIAPLAAELGIDHMRANNLEIADGKLTGELVGPVIDRAGKATALRDFAAEHNVDLDQTIAIGDGANDLDMIAIAGMGIAFNAKPAVKAAADSSVSAPYLDSVLYLMGISREEVEEA